MRTWGDLIKKREAERFVGREQELDIFQREIALEVPEILIYYLTGQGGVGKTTLLRRYQELARKSDFLVAECSEQQKDVPAVLGRFAQQLATLHAPLENFEKRYKVYRQHLREIEHDPEAPQGMAAFLGRTAVRTTFVLADMIPGLRKGLEYIPQETADTHVSDWMSYLAKKMSNKEETALMRDPVSALTPLFFDDLNRLVSKQRILLCFENFEATRPELQEWLLHLPDYALSEQIRLVIAGREPLAAAWDPLRLVTRVVSLDVFNEEEARLFLNTYGVVHEKRRVEILHWSGCLPVLMSWLATPQGEETDPSVPLHDIVERFLRWVTDQVWREVALLVAFTHIFNLDILRVILPQGRLPVDEQTALAWLQSMPFVQSRAEGWRYHPVVRRMMLRYQRQTSPQRYAHEHMLLAEWYHTRCQKQFADAETQWTNEQWRKDILEYIYHYLVADPLAHWEQSIEWFVLAMRKHRTFAGEIIEMLHSDDVQHELPLEQSKAVHMFYEQFQRIKNGALRDGLAMFEYICAMDHLSAVAKGYIFAFRGESHRLMQRFDEALADFDRAIALDENDFWAIALRGETSLLMQRFDEALADFDRAITLDGHTPRAITLRGMNYRFLQRGDEALANFDHAIALDEHNSQALAQRGVTYRLMQRYDEALADFDRALALDESNSWAIAQRGVTYRLMRHCDEALVDFDRALALNESNSWAIAQRGVTYRLMQHYDEALADFDRAIALDEHNSWAIAERGLTYRLTQHFDEALADFDRVIALDTQDAWYRYERAQVYYHLHQESHFRHDMEAALALGKQTRSSSKDILECWRWDFNLAVFALFLKGDTEAHRTYEQLIAECPFLSSLQEALEDLEDVFTVQPRNPLMYALLQLLRVRIQEVENAEVEQM